jgi:hypothetical protein
MMTEDFLDLTHLVRSIQRQEGNPDCFRTGLQHCDRMDCAWRKYCLRSPNNQSVEAARHIRGTESSENPEYSPVDKQRRRQ